MLGLPFQLDLRTSFYTGFAHNEFESEYAQSRKGLIGAWAAVLGPTGTTLRDVSGFQRHGTLTNMNPAADWGVGNNPKIPGYVLTQDAGDEVVNMGDVHGFSRTDPWSAIVVYKRTTAGNDGLLGKRKTSTGYSWTTLSSGKTRLQLLASGSGGLQVDTTTAFSDNEWHHAAITLDGTFVNTGLRMYADGLNETRVVVADDLAADITDAGHMGIGSLGGDRGSNGLRGSIAYVLLWNRVISFEEYLIDYQNHLAALILRPRLFVKAPAAGGDFSISESESVSLSETVARLLTSFVSESESVSLAEALGRTLAHNTSKSESISIAETIGRLLECHVAESEAVSAVDADTVFVPFLVISPAEAISVVDTDTVVFEGSVLFVAETESVSVAETIQRVLVSLIAESESVSVVESIGSALVHNVAESEGVSVAEAVGKLLEALVAESESVSIAEAIGRLLECDVIESDAISVVEEPFVFFEGADILVSASDSISLVESFVVERLGGGFSSIRRRRRR